MVPLAVYCPPLQVEDDAPVILPFERHPVFRRRRRMADVLLRARLERANNYCPCCCRVTVEPIELRDAATNWNGAVIPGTATIVGFHCHACRYEWPAKEPA